MHKKYLIKEENGEVRKIPIEEKPRGAFAELKDSNGDYLYVEI